MKIVRSGILLAALTAAVLPLAKGASIRANERKLERKNPCGTNPRCGNAEPDVDYRSVYIRLHLDAWPCEASWQLEDSYGGEVDSGGDYTYAGWPHCLAEEYQWHTEGPFTLDVGETYTLNMFDSFDDVFTLMITL